MALRRNAITAILPVLLAFSCERATQQAPADTPMFGAPLSKEAEEYLAVCKAEYMAKQEELESKYLKGVSSYDIDFDTGVIHFNRPGKPALAFDIQAVGSVSREYNNWEWAWNNPSIPANISRESANVKIIGERFGLPYLKEGFAPVDDEEFAYYVSSIALKISESAGVYIAKSDNLEIYLLLRNPRDAS
ncbi:MAG: hypothetical protein K1Y02_09745 [Candidatus Hydrogenedentes bacterium]|nr:hypothetical protein [Candidatus Hydrogenedentota bacterium]